jgi:hypothetical protein
MEHINSQKAKAYRKKPSYYFCFSFACVKSKGFQNSLEKESEIKYHCYNQRQ